MNKFFMGCLSFGALALFITQAIAGDSNPSVNMANDVMNDDNGGAVVIETYSSSVMMEPSNQNNDMQPLPGNPGVEVAPVDSPENQPVMIEEEGVIIHQTAD